VNLEELSSPEVFKTDEQSLSDSAVLQEEIKGVLVSSKNCNHCSRAVVDSHTIKVFFVCLMVTFCSVL